jgi:prolyl 4-hydroxylase
LTLTFSFFRHGALRESFRATWPTVSIETVLIPLQSLTHCASLCIYSYPLKGRYFANIFIHFEPINHSTRHDSKIKEKGDVNARYRKAKEDGHGGHEHGNHHGMPGYIVPGSKEAKKWLLSHLHDKKGSDSGSESYDDSQDEKEGEFETHPLHLAAQKGDMEALELAIQEDKDAVHAKDENGWTALHEAARAGHVNVIRKLVQHGADVNAKIDGDGSTALYWAKQEHGADHPVLQLLEELGALEVGPEL